MSTTEEKRLFIGGLVKGVKQEEIMEKFSRFGLVNGIEIKTRITDTDSKTFAYLNLTAEDSAFKKCFTAYNNTKWKGGQLKLQFAKESFLSKLKKEQAEAKTPSEKGKGQSTSVHKSPALESDKKAVPGTPMDDKGTWVMGKYSRVLPVLNIRKPGTRKIVTVDPSKMSHCVKKLKADNYDVEKHSDLTWRLDETTSDINKLRQGQFPELEAPRSHSTPKEPAAGMQESIFSRLQGLAGEEHVTDTEMEVVPAGKTPAMSTIRAHNGYDSDSAGSADTDEIVFKAFGKKISEVTAANSKTGAEPMKKRKKKQSTLQKPGEITDDLAAASSLNTSGSKSIGKKTSESFCMKKEPQIKNGKLEVRGGNREDGKKPQFQFVKAPELKGKALKKSTKLSQSETSATYQHREHECAALKRDRRNSMKKTPEFKGLGMLSSDSEDEGPPTKQAAGPEKSKIQSCDKLSSAAATYAKTLDQDKTQRDISSDSEDTDDVLSHSQKQKEKSVSVQSEERTKIKKSGLVPSGHENSRLSRKSLKEKETEAQDSPKGLNQTSKDTQLSPYSSSKQKETVHNSNVVETVSTPLITKTGSSAAKRKESVGQLFSKEDSSEFDCSMLTDSSFTTPQKKQKRFQPVSCDDSDLDDNDFEKVGRKLAARALGKHQGTSSATDTAVRSEDKSQIRKRKLSQDEKGHLTALQKSHQAYGKIQQEKKKKENLITKTLREGTTESKHHIKFTDSEDEDKGVEMKPVKMTLFSDGDSDNDSESDVDFSLRPQFEGSKGKKLFELQSRILDKRFRFDEDFKSDSDDDEDTQMMEQEAEDEMGMERKRNQEILEKVLGYKPRQRTRLVYEGMSKRRYNPEAAAEPVSEQKPEKRMDKGKVKMAGPENSESEQQNSRPENSENEQQNSRPENSEEDSQESSSSDSEEQIEHKEDSQESSSSDSEEETEHKEHSQESSSSDSKEHEVEGELGPQHTEHNSEEESDSQLNEQTTKAKKDSGAKGGEQDNGEVSSRTSSAEQRESLKDLFSGGSSFTLFGAPDAEDTDESETVTFPNKEKTDKEDTEDESEEEEEEQKEEEVEEHKEDEEEMSVPDQHRAPESDRLWPSLQQQPSFMVARDDPRLTAAVRFFKRPHAEEFEELSERWGDERQKIMQLVRDRHKKACRKERQMKQGVKSRPFVKTKLRTSTKAKKR